MSKIEGTHCSICGGPLSDIEVNHGHSGHVSPDECIQYLKKLRAEVVELHLCEVNYLILKPDQLYRFAYDKDCGKCKRYVEGGK